MERELYERLVKPKPFLWWWVSDKESLSTESIVEGVIAYGDMEEVELLIELVGRDRVRDIFSRQISRKRHSYRPQTVHFFKRVFAIDA